MPFDTKIFTKLDYYLPMKRQNFHQDQLFLHNSIAKDRVFSAVVILLESIGCVQRKSVKINKMTFGGPQVRSFCNRLKMDP